MTRTPHVSIVIPAYNEEQRIAPTLAALDDYLIETRRSYEILVVDDGSTDGTAALVERIGRDRPAVRVIESKPNRGKGSAVRLGMLVARGQIRAMYDADGAIPAAELGKLLALVESGASDIAIGSRYVGGAQVAERPPWYRTAWSRLANLVVRRSVVPGIRDTQCGCKVFTAGAARAIFPKARIDGWAFDLEALALARRYGFSISEVAIRWSDDPRSKINPIADAIAVIRELLTIRRNLRRGIYERFALPLRPAR